MLYLQLFWTYLKIGTFTIGGGYVMLSMIEREIVDIKGWIDREEFLNMIALAQAAPGLIAVNSAIFIGWRIGGWRGVIATVLGAVLPSFFIILAIAMLFQDYKDYPAIEAVFKGVRPAVVALIAAPLCKMAKSAKITWATALIPIAGALLIWLGGLSPVWIILVTALATLAYTYLKEGGVNDLFTAFLEFSKNWPLRFWRRIGCAITYSTRSRVSRMDDSGAVCRYCSC